jgi:H+/Cl- antiporter ClcA
VKAWLKDFPTTALVAVTGCFLAILSGIMFWIAQWREWNIDDTELAIFLSFVAAMCGIAWAWFGKKRDTWDPLKGVPPGTDPEDKPAEPQPNVPRGTVYDP